LALFVSAAHWRHVLRFFAAYTATAFLLSALIGALLL